MSNKNDRWSALSLKDRADLMNMYITNGVSDLKEMKKHYNSFGDGGDTESPVNGGELEAAVVKPNPVNAVLRTYYPIISEYPATGHSELQFFENHPMRPEIPVYLNRPITRGGSNYDYNLITNNCSDATRCAIENITKKKINPFLFTTPGDVKDFVIDNIESSYNTPMENGVISTYFQVPFADAMDAMNNQLDYEIENVKNNNKIPKKRKEEIIKGIENKKYVFQPFKYSNGGRILSGEEDTQISDENTKQSKDFLFRWYNNPTTRAIMNKAFPFEKVVPYYNHEGKEFTGESAVRGHIANAIYHTPEYIEKLEDNVGGRYIHDLRNPHIIYNENYIYNNDKVDPQIATHELTHALQYALPQNTLRTSKPVKQELKKGIVPDKYLDSMTEIGARINSFRKALGLTPEKRDYSPEDAETLMNTYIERFGEDATSKLNRFTPETLAGYLNYLAYNDKDVIPTFDSDVNYASNGGKLNVFSGKENTNNSQRKLEAVMRSTNGITGQVFSKEPPFISVPTIIAGAKAYYKMKQDNPVMPSTINDYTGAAVVDGAFKTDGELGFATTDELISKLGGEPVDFIDSYVYNAIPFEEQGVIKKTSTPEKHIYRTKLSSMDKEVPVYQTHRDTLDTKLVRDLNAKLAKGQISLIEENFTHKDSPFQIGDTGVYYDGNNGFIARVRLEDGTLAEKALDIFDFKPSEWNYKVGKKAKEGLEFIDKNGHPYLMTSPWYYKKDTRTEEQRLHSMGITLNENGEVVRNVGDASGKVWDLYEALDYISSHPYETRLKNGKIL